MLDAVLSIKGAKFTCIPSHSLTYAIASGSILMVDRLLNIKNFKISQDDISAAINSHQLSMFDKVINLYHEQINHEDISHYNEYLKIAWRGELKLNDKLYYL